MPKKLFPSEPAVIFTELLIAAQATDSEFTIKTDDPRPPSFADVLIAEHYPAQTELPLDN